MSHITYRYCCKRNCNSEYILTRSVGDDYEDLIDSSARYIDTVYTVIQFVLMNILIE